MDFESYEGGRLLYIGVEEGETVPVDTLIAILGADGEDITTIVNANRAKSNTNKQTAPVNSAEVSAIKTRKEDSNPIPMTDKANVPATIIRMPLFTDLMDEAFICKWHFKVGDTVKSDDALADVETDKATVELVGYEAGTLLYIGAEEFETVKVNAIVAIVGKAGTDITPLLDEHDKLKYGVNRHRDLKENIEEIINNSDVRKPTEIKTNRKISNPAPKTVKQRDNIPKKNKSNSIGSQTIKIFLASSSELKEERERFEIFIGRENKRLNEKGIFLRLDIWEDFLDAVSQTRLQNEYNLAINSCDIFVMLFFTKVGKFTTEEFEKAFKHFKESDTPKIYTYFKIGDIKSTNIDRESTNSLWNFQDKLKELGHFQTVFESNAEIHLHFKSQLEKLYDL